MKYITIFAAYIAAISLSLGTSAQAPAGAPAGATGICKDGSYSRAAKKSGACSGHKGVQSWYAAAPTAPNAPAAAASPTKATPAPAASAMPPAASPAKTAPSAVTPAPKAAPVSGQAPAAGGGPGMVWVNTASKTYHCPGTSYYGKTKAGKYVTEDAAKGEGDHADHGKVCSK